MPNTKLAIALSALTALGDCFIPSKPGKQTEQLSKPHKLLGSSFGIPSQNATYDFVIAGAGLAGSVVATRLSQAFPKMSIAVVEAGSFYEISNSNWSQIPFYSTQFVGGDPDDWQPLIDWGLVTVPLSVSSHISLSALQESSC